MASVTFSAVSAVDAAAAAAGDGGNKLASPRSSCSDYSASDDSSEKEEGLRGSRASSLGLSDSPAQLRTVCLTRYSTGYGIELCGTAPPVISRVFGAAATESCVCEGDKLLEVNGKDVRELGHQEAGQLISECVESVTLLLKPREIPCESVIYSGWLEKKGGSGLTPRNWRRRWFVLRDNCIAYYYSTPEDTRALGAIVLRNYTVSKATHDTKKQFAFKLVKGGSRTYCLCADTEQEMNKVAVVPPCRWAQVLTEATVCAGEESVHFSGPAHNVSLSALSIREPECHGTLFKQGHNIRTWKKRYCVLKDNQLFYYGKMHHTTAYGVMDLHGYSVAMGKTTDKKFHFHALPVERTQLTYNFYCESTVERERWIKVLQKSCLATSVSER